jgi:hypothetical protein
MKTLILILMLCIVSIGSTYQPEPKIWEYKFLYQCDERKANNLATDGWELTEMSMTAYGSLGVATCVFKRPK